MDEDGCWALHARFTPEQGERIKKAIDAAVDEIEAEQRDASAETSAEPDFDKPLPCPIEQKRADAVERLADGFLSGQQKRVSRTGMARLWTMIWSWRRSFSTKLEWPGRVCQFL